jgi:serine phosphatase RsbU (regulator of sigma subunit)
LLITRDPAEVLAMVDRYALVQSYERLTTTCLAVMDSVEHTMEIATAGHPPPFLGYHGASAAPLRVHPGRPLGVGGGEHLLERVELPSSGQLVFLTDGLIDEGRTDADERLRALAGLMVRNSSDGPEVLADAIVIGLTAPQPASDDLAVLVVQWSS